MDKYKILNILLILALIGLAYMTNSIDSGKKKLEMELITTQSQIEKFHVEQSKLIEKHNSEIKLLTNKVKELNKEKIKVSYYESGKVKEFSSNKFSLKDLSATSSDITHGVIKDHNLNVISNHKEDNNYIKQSIKQEESWYKRKSTLWIILGIGLGAYAIQSR